MKILYKMFELLKTTAELINILAMAGIIIFGSIVHATAKLKIARDTSEAFTVADFVILSVIASFSGLIAGLLATIFLQEQTLVLAASGIGAFLGIAGLNAISSIFLEFLTELLVRRKK